MINNKIKLKNLSPELINNIFSYLSEIDLLVLTYTTKYFKDIVKVHFHAVVTDQKILDQALSFAVNSKNIERVKILVRAGAFPSSD